jgi:hypothetical protein
MPDTIDPADMQLHYKSELFRFRDPLIEEFTAIVELEFRAQGRIHDGPEVMAVVACDLKSDQPTMTVQPTNFGDKAGLFALDLEHPLFASYGGTLRHYFNQTYPSSRIEDNPFPISPGVCGYVLVTENGKQSLLQVERSRHLATLERSFGPSAAGTIDYHAGYQSLKEMAEAAMLAELKEELALNPEDCELIFLACARELFRGEHPQVFFLISTTLSPLEIHDRMESVAPEDREFEQFFFLPLDKSGRLAKDQIEMLNPEARMNYFLLEEYFSEKRR